MMFNSMNTVTVSDEKLIRQGLEVVKPMRRLEAVSP